MKRLETFMGTVHGPGESESCLFAHKNQLADSLTAASSSRGAQLGADIAEWIISLVDHQDSRVHGALQAAQFFGRRIHAELEAINDRLAAIQGNVDASRQTVLSQPTSSGWLRRSGTTGYQAALAVHAELLCELIRYQAAIKGLNALESRVNATADSVREHWKSLTQFANRFRSLPKHLERAPTANGTKNEDRVASCYNAHGTELVERLDSFCTTNLFTDERRLSKVLACAGAVDVLADDLLVAARRAILKACRDTDNEFLARIAGSDSQQQLNSMVRQSLGGATPDLLRVGGAKRLLVMAPRTQCHEQLCHTIESISGDQATLCSEDNETVILCYEGEDIAWDGVESMLIRQRHDCVEMAERLHTRINIDWGARPANRELVAAAH
jgi:hypothetical protein